MEQFYNFFCYSFAVNAAMLLIWWLALVFARDLVYNIHSKWFAVSKERFHEIHYSGLMTFKMLIIGFNLAPLIALCCMKKG